MSHAANLRAHQQHAASTKRRKLSSDTSTRPTTNGLNGALAAPAFTNLSAKQIRNAKASSKPELGEAAARIGRAAEDDDDVTEDVNGLHQDSSDNSSQESDEDGHDDEDAQDTPQHLPSKVQKNLPNANNALPHQLNGLAAKQPRSKASPSPPPDDVDEEPSGEPSFGDLLQAQAAEQIEVPADDANAANMLSSQPRGTLAAPSAASLGTVLTQALRSNDAALLESCLQISNLQSIRATVERLPPMHAATLLQKLAERMHKRPGRAGSLMVWVQWTIVAHGGYLATQPAAMTQVKELYRVVKMRATSLQPLLALKGKLDMLEAQVALRRRYTTAANEEQENVVYVEDEESSDEDGSLAPLAGNVSRRAQVDDPALLGSSDDDEVMPLTNGTSVPASDDEDADAGLEEELESDDEEDLIDDEAESTDNDSDGGASEDDIVFDDVEDDGSSDAEASRPIKRTKAGR